MKYSDTPHKKIGNRKDESRFSVKPYQAKEKKNCMFCSLHESVIDASTIHV
jgi:ATP-dependent helicase/DNAse subunit B